MKTRTIAASCLAIALSIFGVSAASADTTATPELSHQAELAEATTAEIVVTSSDALAGESLSVLILDDDADAADPAAEDIVFIEQYELDDAGAIDFRVQLPTAALEDYDIALNTAAGTERYLASLAGGEEDSGTAPNDEPTGEPDDGGTTDPDDRTPTPDDGATSNEDDSPEDESGAETENESSNGNVADVSSPGTDEDPSGTDTTAGDSAQEAQGEQADEGFLASTGASVLIGVVIALAAITTGVLLVLKRRRSA